MENIASKKTPESVVVNSAANRWNIKLPFIAIISSERYPHHDTNTQQVVKNAYAIHQAGVPVELVLPSQIKGYLNNKYDLGSDVKKYYNIPDGLIIREFKTVPASDLRLEKLFHSVLATIAAVFNNKIDIIYTRNRVAAFIALLFGKKLIFETYRRLGNEFPKTMKWLSRKTKNPSFVGMVLHSKVAADSMENSGIPKNKLFVLHNGYDQKDMQPILSKNEARIKLGLSKNEKYIVYTGNMQKNKCIEILLDIAARLPEYKFLLVGGRDEDLERLKNYEKSIGNKANVIYTGRQPIGVVSEYLYAADALIIPPVSAPLEKYGRTVLPFKIFPYLAAGRAIIAPDLADMRELLQHNINAILVQPDDPEQQALAINELLLDNELQNKLIKGALNTSSSLTWLERGKKFKNWIAEKYNN